MKIISNIYVNQLAQNYIGFKLQDNLRAHSVTTWNVGGSKNVCFCPRSGYENCPRRGGGVKNGKILST
jgi:hypothetical protein